jgi:flagellin
MALSINHNLMAMNTARNLNSSYAAIATSTRRLSSGLRVGTAADDAAGLAIREMMRADISSINQGVRNANDAVSAIQTADGGLASIDALLTRAKELATQASTGTYTSDQRAIINNEFSSVKNEIQRVAKATDFNGIGLLNGLGDMSKRMDSTTWQQEMSGGFGDPTASVVFTLHKSNQYLYSVANTATGIQVKQYDGESWSQLGANGLGLGLTQSESMANYSGDVYMTATDGANCRVAKIDNGVVSDVTYNLSAIGGEAYGITEFNGSLYTSTPNGVYRFTGDSWAIASPVKLGDVNNTRITDLQVYDDHLYAGTVNAASFFQLWKMDSNENWSQVGTGGFGTTSNTISNLEVYDGKLAVAAIQGRVYTVDQSDSIAQINTTGFGNVNNGDILGLKEYKGRLYAGTTNLAEGSEVWEWNGKTWAQVADAWINDANNIWMRGMEEYNGRLYVGTRDNVSGANIYSNEIDTRLKIHFGSGNSSAEDYYYMNVNDSTVNGIDLENTTIATQSKAQQTSVSRSERKCTGGPGQKCTTSWQRKGPRGGPFS